MEPLSPNPKLPTLVDLRQVLREAPPGFRWLRPLAGPLQRFLALDWLNQTYHRTLTTAAGENFFEKGLEATEVGMKVTAEDLSRIPAKGPLLVVSNHPHGAIDGLILGALFAQRRPDMRLLGNHFLNQMEPIQEWNIPVDPFGGEGAARRNVAPLKKCLRWLREGGVLVTFPAGAVSHLHLRRARVCDSEWSPNIAALVRHTACPVLPVFICGRNRTFFQIAGMLHPLLRTAQLARETRALRGRAIEVRIGKPIPPGRLEEFKDDQQLIDFLRLKSYVLRERKPDRPSRLQIAFPSLAPLMRRKPELSGTPLAPAESPAALEQEVQSLPACQCLVDQGEYQVFCARAAQIPLILQELGRLREETFRAVGEGTGRSLDLDGFDQSYQHLFLWHREKRAIAGAYRLGPLDEILALSGRSGLYTTTLFRFRPGFLEKLPPAVELGRSFIALPYQRKHSSLALIWRGIGEFIVRNPRYRLLFGPVSISSEYRSLSRNLIVQYLRRNSLNQEFAPLVKARRPPRSGDLASLEKRALHTTVQDIEDISALVSEIETDQKGVPVLLRQYLKLNATFLSFNVDPEFADVIDGLVMVDLLKTDPRILRRYMTGDGLDRFYAAHGVAPAGGNKEGP